MNIADVLDAITAVMAADRTIFVPTAQGWLRDLLLIMAIWITFRAALEQDFLGWRTNMIRLGLTYLGILVVLRNWEYSCHLLTDEVHFLRAIVEHGQESAVFEAVTKITTDVASASPILPTPGDWVVIYILEFILAAFEGAIYFVLTYGYIMAAICEIVGPLLLALAVVPALMWMFFGWIRSFIGYAMYPLFGAIYADIVAHILTFFMQRHPAPWSMSDLHLMLVGFLMFILASAIGIWKLPNGIGDILGGRVGSSAALIFRWARV